MIGNELGRLRNNVLRRRMFTTPQQRAALARGPVGINASGPELMRATSTTGNPFIDQGLVNRRQVMTQVPPGTARIRAQAGLPTTPPSLAFAGDQGEFEGVGPQTDPGMTPPVNQRSEQEAEESRRIGSGSSAILEDDPNVSNLTPTPTPTPTPDADPNKKPKKPSAKSTMDDILDRIAGMRGDKDADKKTRKQKFQEAKDFLIEAGLTDAKDVRTDRDFLLMLGGLKFAAGSGTGSMSQDAVAALSTVLGTFAGGKKDEREQEQKLRMAAAERVLRQEDTEKATAAARELALDKLSIEAALKKAEMEQDPKMIREVKAIMDETGASFTEALRLQQATSTKRPGFQEQVAAALMAPPYNLSAADAFLIANNRNLIGDAIEEGPDAVKEALAAIKALGTQQSSGNTGNTGNSIPLTGNEDQTT